MMINCTTTCNVLYNVALQGGDLKTAETALEQTGELLDSLKPTASTIEATVHETSEASASAGVELQQAGVPHADSEAHLLATDSPPPPQPTHSTMETQTDPAEEPAPAAPAAPAAAAPAPKGALAKLTTKIKTHLAGMSPEDRAKAINTGVGLLGVGAVGGGTALVTHEVDVHNHSGSPKASNSDSHSGSSNPPGPNNSGSNPPNSSSPNVTPVANNPTQPSAQPVHALPHRPGQ